MPLIPCKIITAISAVVEIALYSREGPLSAIDLAKRLQLPSRHLEPVLNALTRQGILVGVRGPNGGYKTAKEQRAISAYDIFQAIKTIEVDMSTQSYPGLAGAVVLPALAQAEQIFASALRRINVEDLVRAATLQILADAKPAHSSELNDKLALQSTPLARKPKRVRTDL